MRILHPILVVLGIVAFPLCIPAATKPNILLIAVDDLRDTLGCYGNTAVKTPNIDALAARGVVFDRAYVQYPVCNPSRSSFLTGLRPDQTHVTDNTTMLRSKRPNVMTLPQSLKKSGWHSAAFGKIFHLGGGRNAELKNQWMDLPRSWHSAQAFEATDTGKRKLAGRDLTNGKLKWCHWGAMDGGDDDQPDGQIASAVIAKMEELGDQPWMIGCGFMKPHDPFLAPAKYFDLYPEDSLKLHRDPANQTPAPPLAVGFGAFGETFRAFTDTERMEFLRAYYACTSFMDAQVGRVLEALDRLGLRERTLVILLGDHGYHLGEREWWNKNTLFDRSCRAPLIVSGPGVGTGHARGLVEFIDLFPTVTELCGIDPPHGLAGTSLWPQLKDPQSPGKDAAFTIVTRGAGQRGDSIRTDRWRYTEWSDGTRELYDHDADPEETVNVVESNQQVASELSARLGNR
ncbi:MAG: sulfatase [Verrucomicrobiales bacterium]|nr:sulfatase [Verrucomicrobiales bacterium]